MIFENNSEPVAKKAKRPCGAGTSDHRANFDNREKQGGSLQSNTVLPAKSREAEREDCKTPDLASKQAAWLSEITPAHYSARFVAGQVESL